MKCIKTYEIKRARQVRHTLLEISKEESENFIKNQFPTLSPFYLKCKLREEKLESIRNNSHRLTADNFLYNDRDIELNRNEQKSCFKSLGISNFFDKKKRIVSNGMLLNKIPKIKEGESLNDSNNARNLNLLNSYKEPTKLLLTENDEDVLFKSTMNIHELIPSSVKKCYSRNSSSFSNSINDIYKYNQKTKKISSDFYNTDEVESQSEEELIIDGDNLPCCLDYNIAISSLPIFKGQEKEKPTQKQEKYFNARLETDLNVVYYKNKISNREESAFTNNRTSNNKSTLTTVDGFDEPNYNVDNVTEFNSNISITNNFENGKKGLSNVRVEGIAPKEKSNMKNVLSELNINMANIVDYSHEFGFTYKKKFDTECNEHTFKSRKGDQNYVREEKYNIDNDKETSYNNPNKNTLKLSELKDDYLNSLVNMEENNYDKFEKIKPTKSCNNAYFIKSKLDSDFKSLYIDKCFDFVYQISKSNQNITYRPTTLSNSIQVDCNVKVFTV